MGKSIDKTLLSVIVGSIIIIISIILIYIVREDIPEKFSGIKSGQSLYEVEKLVGKPERIIPANEINKSKQGERWYWYYPIPLNDIDLDSRYVIVVFDDNYNVLRLIQFSN